MPDSSPRYTIEDLKYLMERLRDPERGCPWDVKQTFESIVPHTLEEAYEVADAIEQGDRNEMRDELGDLLFQVIFYARIAEEEGSFDFTDITDAITTKLLRRHPHVFPDKELHAYHPEGTRFTDDQIKGQWDAIKAEERALKAKLAEQSGKQDKTFSILDDIPVALPALGRAEKLQRRASNVGFDWDNIDDVFAKLEEEIGEIREVLNEAKERSLRDPDIHEKLTDEVGDLLFCGVNLSRFLKVNPDEALRSCNTKFTSRFNYIESALSEQGKAFEDCTLKELDQLWDEAKRRQTSDS
ncbi:MAG: nucleoside triphosphate pyrophosphohydrolase [Oleiphilaceae bacterium]|nr:nucleoside triphosphate pyrophosphohydrolase [Oleiphilaceae bacterium]